MAKDTLSEAEKEALAAVGPITELQLDPEMLKGLSIVTQKSIAKQIAFLRAFAMRGLITDGLKAASVGRGVVTMRWRKDAWFEELYQAAALEASDRIVAEAHRRAVEGYDEPVIYQGMPTIITDKETGAETNLTVRKYSDSLMAILLKGADPAKYRENHKVEHGFGEGQVGVLVVPAAVSPEEWAKAAKEQQAKYAGNSGEAK